MFTASPSLQSIERIRPKPGLHAFCPFCGTSVISKCGIQKSWHFAHTLGTCESWAEPDSEWTAEWKSNFPLTSIEVLFNGRIADLFVDDVVIKLSHTSLTHEQITRYETHFSPMIWLIDARSAKIKLFPDPENFVRFTWSRPKTAWLQATSTLFLDLGTELLQVKKHRTNSKGQIRGWGYIRPRNFFYK